jgi:prepilin-type N-terminal cleavage/methylation domain-containing protein/prepilin-type processing-associated H-X9-DG protein
MTDETMIKQCRSQLHAFTLVELLVVIALLAVLAALQLPALANTKAKVQRASCSGNLKRVGLAFRTWSDRNYGRMPMSVPASQGGAAEAIGIRANSSFLNGNLNPPKGVFGMFYVMSNELVTPKILYCPSEYRADISQGTIFGNTFGTNAGCFSDFQTSYFVGVDANDLRPNMLLAGDHNLGAGATPPSLQNIYGESGNWFISMGTNTTWVNASPGWADNQHVRQGNVAFADGSVQNLTTAQFRSALNKTGDIWHSPGSFNLAIGSTGHGVNRLQFP